MSLEMNEEMFSLNEKIEKIQLDEKTQTKIELENDQSFSKKDTKAPQNDRMMSQPVYGQPNFSHQNYSSPMPSQTPFGYFDAYGQRISGVLPQPSLSNVPENQMGSYVNQNNFRKDNSIMMNQQPMNIIQSPQQRQSIVYAQQYPLSFQRLHENENFQ